MEPKKCSKCGEVKALDEFPKDKAKKDGYRNNCKACQKIANKAYYDANANGLRAGKRDRAKVLREADPDWGKQYQRDYRAARLAAEPGWEKDRSMSRRYGITREQYEALLAHQGGVCAGCGVGKCPSGNNFAVDHDHDHCAGRNGCPACIRGLLCMGCNVADALVGRPVVNWEVIGHQDHTEGA
ncbi:endonuclease VII domain-containing protein [Streptomyces griseus]|uniref:endonuclease domain-containing protein n=1 Tax=Streptomyces griseus TaxID=1911 RepID=UPI00386D9D26|nr:endonuclease VII domain-containing protein [Streptomyces griseus]WTD71203.1 endonuclease VII domain-containing protein [Streptomyces griseus]